MQRVVSLDGGINLRDLGGYRTADGRVVRWHTLYRSGVMSYLTASGERELDELGIRSWCDLRSRIERERETVRWPGADVKRLEWDYDARPLDLRNLAVEGLVSAELARSAMTALYRKLPMHFEKQYSGLFLQLAAGHLPLVFGCSAGKDRTGVAAALILTCLGVPWESVVNDFTLTNQAVNLERDLFQTARSGGIGLSNDRSHLLALNRAARAAILEASPQYLKAAFDQICRDHGSVEAYLRDGLRVTPDEAVRIRSHLLE